MNINEWVMFTQERNSAAMWCNSEANRSNGRSGVVSES